MSLTGVGVVLIEYYLLNQMVVSLMILMRLKEEDDREFALKHFERIFAKSLLAEHVREMIGVVKYQTGDFDTDRAFPEITIMRNA